MDFAVTIVNVAEGSSSKSIWDPVVAMTVCNYNHYAYQYYKADTIGQANQQTKECYIK